MGHQKGLQKFYILLTNVCIERCIAECAYSSSVGSSSQYLLYRSKAYNIKCKFIHGKFYLSVEIIVSATFVLTWNFLEVRLYL